MCQLRSERKASLSWQRHVDSPDVPVQTIALVSVASSSKSPSKHGAISKCIPVQVYVVEAAGQRYLAGFQTGGVGLCLTRIDNIMRAGSKTVFHT